MSLQAPVRRLPLRCLSRRAPVTQQRRTALFGRGKPDQDTKAPADNPILEEWNRKRAAETASADPSQRGGPAIPAPGDIASSSIFEDDRRVQEQLQREAGAAQDDDRSVTVGGIRRDPTAIARVLQPDPNARERWERKKVIQMVRKGGRLTKAQFIKRTEREHLVKSHNMKTSVKKLGMLARQISGKTIDDAIVQMRFSKKKVAQEVLKQLEFARDEAVVMRGMGLGNVASSSSDAESKTLTDSSPQITGTTQAELEASKAAKKEQAIEIQLKDGKRHKVADRSKIYIDQAWVGRGPYGQLPDFRARGRVNIMRTPWTSLSVVLKEEATRLREWEEREEQRRKKVTDKVWTHLPDRPIQIQRQWYSW